MPNDLAVHRISTGIPGQSPMLINFNHIFRAGTLTIVLGCSGTGKTMLLELLSGLREPLAGEVSLGGLPLWKHDSTRQKPNRKVLLRIGTAFQHPEQQLFADTIRSEFLYTLRPFKLTRDEVHSRIQAGLVFLPEEAGSRLERDPFALSGGQQRRLSLALLEAAAPEWLLLDEPTAGIDSAGKEIICEQLQQRKAKGLGTIVVTHDPEALITATDSVIILYNGTFWSGTPDELAEQPQIWSEAGLEPPDRLVTLQALRAANLTVPKGWPSAAEVAAALTAPCSKGLFPGRFQQRAQQLHRSREIQDAPDDTIGLPSNLSAYTSKSSGKSSGISQYDPRAIWLAYMLISPGILYQSTWAGWIFALMVTIAVIVYCKVPVGEWFKPAAGLVIFTLIASMMSGLTSANATDMPDSASSESIGTTGSVLWIITWQLPWNLLFRLAPAAETFFTLSLLIMIMLIGFVLLSGINHLHMKRALEQGLRPLKRLGLPVDQLALAASLMLRFLPMIMEEWQRFARLSAARGKYPFRAGQIPVWRMRMAMIPILASLLRLGEQLSLLLMVRGLGLESIEPTIAYRLRMKDSDYVLIGAAVILLLSLMLTPKLL